MCLLHTVLGRVVFHLKKGAGDKFCLFQLGSRETQTELLMLRAALRLKS